jgi:hypothetical protein
MRLASLTKASKSIAHEDLQIKVQICCNRVAAHRAFFQKRFPQCHRNSAKAATTKQVLLQGGQMADIANRLYRKSVGASPIRLPWSVRRTTSIDVTWPQGRGQPAQFDARARDIFTRDLASAPHFFATSSYEAKLTQDRQITAISCTPDRPQLSSLIGERAGNGLRKALRELIPDDLASANPLYLLLDDLSGASLVSGWVWSLWDPDWVKNMIEAAADPTLSAAFGDRAGVCIGFAPGSSAFGMNTDRSVTFTSELQNPEDMAGWHDLPRHSEMAMRRARRIDIWQDDCIRIEAAFQDSATTPDKQRAVVHEYVIEVSADPVSFEVTGLNAIPKVLPFTECPGAAVKAQMLVGTPLTNLREVVLEHLRRTEGCTHLNDALRALADVPKLLEHLENQPQPLR